MGLLLVPRARRVGAVIAGIACALALAACSSNGGTGQSGAGGASGSVASSSSSSGAFAPPDPPKVAFLGGAVLKAPKVQAIAYTADTGLADMEAFLQELTTTSYWSDTTSEYGVGKLTILPTIKLTGTPPASLADADLVTMLKTNTSGANAAWGPADSSTIYLFLMPQGSLVKTSGTACTDFDGYHAEAMVSGTPVAYAVSSACPGFDGPNITLLEERTVNASHELIEAATDPFPTTSPAYAQEDLNDILWSISTGGELADMCEFNEDAYVIPTGGKYTVQRSWSNAAAAAMKNPCLPRAPDAVYFNSYADLETVSWTYPGQPAKSTKGVKIPVGQTKTIDVHLYSTGPTSGPWKVQAYDFNAVVYGTTANLAFSFDKDTGESGDTLHLTIKSVSEDAKIGGAGFLLFSDLGTRGAAGFAETLSMGLVVP